MNIVGWSKYQIKRRLAQFQGQPPMIQLLSGIKGQLSVVEALVLYELACSVDSGCIVEIGSYQGRSTVALAEGVRAGYQRPIYAIEPHEAFEGLLGGLFGPEDRAAFYETMLVTKAYRYVRLVNLSSEIVAEGWQEPISLLWIDGDHSYEGVRRDFEVWEPFLEDRARIAFHDSLDSRLGPARYIQELIATKGYEQVSQFDSITVLQKSNGA